MELRILQKEAIILPKNLETRHVITARLRQSKASVHTLWSTTTTQRGSWSPCIYVPWIPVQCIRRFRRWFSIEMWKEVGIPSICRHKRWTGCLSLFQHVKNSWIPIAQLVQKNSSLLFWEFACNLPRMLSYSFFVSCKSSLPSLKERKKPLLFLLHTSSNQEAFLAPAATL